LGDEHGALLFQSHRSSCHFASKDVNHEHRPSTIRLSCSFFIVSLLLVAASMTSPAASAQHRPHRGASQWHGDLGRFHQHDWQVWRGGHWTHAHHDGRVGWWWVVGPSWYFYMAPVYPYPSPWAPAEVNLMPMPIEPPMPPAQFWYYCEAARNYYPYVSRCPGDWTPVPAAPGSTGAAPMRQVP
jgi:hypothetical protein